MHFVFIANSWSAAADNPTSKHQIALELVRAGHRVLWLEGAGMRRPNMGSGADRSRIWKRVVAALKGPRAVPGVQGECMGVSGYGGIGVEEHALTPLLRHSHTSGIGVKPHSHTPTLPHSHTPSLHVLSPLLIPLPKYAAIRWLNGWWFALCARFWSWRLGFVNPVLINYLPVLCHAQSAMRSMGVWGCRSVGVEDRDPKDEHSPQPATPPATPVPPYSLTPILPHSRIVYHCVDRWDSFGTYDARMMRKVDEQCCRYADVVIASSRELYERCRTYNQNTHLVNHGVDLAHFRKAVDEVQATPADLPQGGPIIGFVGLLSEWVDQNLIVRLARDLPQAQVMLIGKADVDIAALKTVPNIHCLGPKPYRELPAYLAHCAVTIIPFTINELTRAVNPIKLREMLAAGCPVVSTALPEVKAWIDAAGDSVKSFAVCTETVDEFVSHVRERIEHPVAAGRRHAICAAVENETWAAKTREIVEQVWE